MASISLRSGIPDEWRAMIDLARPYTLLLLPESCQQWGVPLDELAVLIGDLHGSVARQLAEAKLGTVDQHIREAEDGGYPPIFSTIMSPGSWRQFLDEHLPLARKYVERRPPQTIPLIIIDDENGVHVLLVTPELEVFAGGEDGDARGELD